MPAMPRKRDKPQARPGREARRPVLERPPDPGDAASPDDQAYMEGRRLRQRLAELNP
jgi:hypothetical protein